MKLVELEVSWEFQISRFILITRPISYNIHMYTFIIYMCLQAQKRIDCGFKLLKVVLYSVFFITKSLRIIYVFYFIIKFDIHYCNIINQKQSDFFCIYKTLNSTQL